MITRSRPKRVDALYGSATCNVDHKRTFVRQSDGQDGSVRLEDLTTTGHTDKYIPPCAYHEVSLTTTSAPPIHKMAIPLEVKSFTHCDYDLQDRHHCHICARDL